MRNRTINPITQPSLWGLALVLAVAAFLRMGDGALGTHFRYDEGTLALLALDMVNGVNLPLLGIPSSAGVPNSPMTVYALALPFAISSSPLFVTLSIAVWNVLGVGLLWFIAHRYVGIGVGLVAGLVYAVSPYAVYYSRSIWAQDYHTTFILLALLLGLLGFYEGRRWAQALCLPVMLVGIQIHFAAWTLLPLILILLWMGRKQLSWRAMAVSVALSIAVMLPFALGIMGQSTGAAGRFSTILNIIRGGLTFRADPIHQMIDLTIGTGLETTARNQAEMLLHTVPRPDVLWTLLGVLALAGLALVWLARWRRFAPLLTAWALITPLVFIPEWTGSGVYHHYFVPTLPGLALLTAIGFVGLLRLMQARGLSTRWVYGGGIAVLAVILLTQAVWVRGWQRFIATTYAYSEADGQTTTPLGYLMNVRRALLPAEDVIVIGGSPHESNSAVWSPLLYESAACVRDLVVDGGFVTVLPDHPFSVLIAPHPPDFVVPDLYLRGAWREIPLRPGEPPYIIQRFDRAPEWAGPAITAVETLPFTNGVQWTGYALADGWMFLRWSLPAAQALPDGSSLNYFGHFLDADGERIAQRDTVFWPGHYWCAGDTLITQVDVSVPENTVTLRVGLYVIDAANTIISESLVDADGQLHGNWVDVPLP